MNLLKNLNISFLDNKRKIFTFLFIISFVARIIISYFYGDKNLENEWAILVNNLYNYGTLSMLRFDNLLVPNLWMPPIYAYFVYLHTIIFGFDDNLTNYVIASQIIISSLTTIIFYKIILNFFSTKICIYGSVLFSFFPLIVYSASQISSVTIYLFLLLIFVLLIINLLNQNSRFHYQQYILIGFVAGLLILTRRDFILIYFFSLIYSFLFFKASIKKLLLILLVTSITISPYILRNYVSFDKFIVHSGLGYNLWKAYNSNAKVDGYHIESDKLKSKINLVPKDIYYRINEDKIYLEEAKNFIKDNPNKTIELFFHRLFSLLFIDLQSSQQNYYNIFHILPNTLISFFSIIGLILYNKKNSKFNYLVLTMMIILLVYSLFALMPRYKIYILPFQILLSISFFDYLIKKLSKKY